VPEKVRYEIALTQPLPIAPLGDQIVRSVTGDDLHGLARLMLDAYEGTIDYDDETIEDAIEEVGSFFDDGEPLLNRSYAVEGDGTILSAVLVSLVEATPFIGYVMTLPSHKNRGLARLVTTTAVERLARDGHKRIVLYITDGNTASEALFRSLGAVQVRP